MARGVAGLKMPPKGKFSSTTSLLTNVQRQILLKNEEIRLDRSNSQVRLHPPILPPKASNTVSKPNYPPKAMPAPSQDVKNKDGNSHKNNAPKRRVSISTDADQIIGRSRSDEEYDCLKVNDRPNESRERNGVTAVDSTNQPPMKDGKSILKLNEHHPNEGRLSVPDLIPSHEITNVGCMRGQTKEINKSFEAMYNNKNEDKANKARLIHPKNKDLEDLTEKGLPSVKDLVNKFIPNRTAVMRLRHSPEPKPRQSLLKKVIKR